MLVFCSRVQDERRYAGPFCITTTQSPTLSPSRLTDYLNIVAQYFSSRILLATATGAARCRTREQKVRQLEPIAFGLGLQETVQPCQSRPSVRNGVKVMGQPVLAFPRRDVTAEIRACRPRPGHSPGVRGNTQPLHRSNNNRIMSNHQVLLLPRILGFLSSTEG
jgi:hypothetical protein